MTEHELVQQSKDPAALIEIALKSNATAETLERLFALQERWQANEARKAYVEAVAAFKAEAPKISRNRHVKHNDFWHATLDRIVAAAAPVMSKHGLSHRWETQHGDGGAITVSCVLTHVGGHEERVTLSAKPDDSGRKNSIQAIGSTVTYLQRYTLMAITGLAASDADDDGESAEQSEPITTEQAEEIKQMLLDTDSDVPRFLETVSKACKLPAPIENVDSMPSSAYGKAMAALRMKQRMSKEDGDE